MALARCECCGYPNGKGGNTYSERPRVPVGHPESGIVCGTESYINPAHVYLTTSEEMEYDHGRRVFEITGGHRAAKFQIQ
jgi:hypothetical protein